MSRILRIAIATAGRFHVLDLARELHALGHRVRFYSYVPKKRAVSFGLAPECHVDLLPLLAPLIGWGLAAPKLAPALRDELTWRALDQAVIRRLEPCDVFICMSGIYLDAIEHARRAFGAKTIVVRGSKHILAQDEILAAIPGAGRPTPKAIERELLGYQAADMIDVPSEHAAQSFERDAGAFAKVVRNPYGVDLAMFPQRAAALASKPIRFAFAGSWSLRKGCDLLAPALDLTADVALSHIGSAGDAPFPERHPRLARVGQVEQSKLAEHYAAHDGLVLPSREDGFGMVLGQALACGLPIVCSPHTGGADLRHTPALADRVTVMRDVSAEAISAALAQVRDRIREGPPFAPLTEQDRQSLSWRAYAERYERNLMSLF